MEQPIIELKITDCRAIHKAKIGLEGITVLAGENGSGKSTIANLFFNTLYVSQHYEDLIAEELYRDLFNYLYIIDEVNDNIKKYNKKINYVSSFDYKRFLLDGSLEVFSKRDLLFKNLENLFKDVLAIKLDQNYERRLCKLIYHQIDEKIEELDLKICFDKFIDRIDQIFKIKENDFLKRSISVLEKHLNSVFRENNILKKYDIYEYGLKLIDRRSKTLSLVGSIKNVFYFDSPELVNQKIMFYRNIRQDLHLKADFSALMKSVNNLDIPTKNILQMLNSEILDGEAYYDDDNFGVFKFKRTDEKIFNLEECATGLKVFSQLQLLLKSGSLSKDSLVIWDEPEAYLHPKWIVEFARVIVYVHKYIGTKFLITTHNPDMVSALKWISQKEGTISSLQYYLAEKYKDYSYDYLPIGVEIENIYESFNIALDNIEKYGSNENV